MILQRDKPVSIWGTAKPNEKITIQFLNKKYNVRADSEGNWKASFPAQKAGGPHQMTLIATNKIILKEILFGDVWFCSGQSNMVHQMNIHDVTYAEDIAKANYPNIRQFLVPTLTNLQGPVMTLPKGTWMPAMGDQVRPFSAVAYFFARKIYEKYGVPIGIINASVGGTPIEAWTSSEGLKDFNDLTKTIERNRDTAYINGLLKEMAARQKAFIPPVDKGLTGEKPWYHPEYAPKDWRPINIPGYWEDQGIRNLDGIVWYRKEIDIPAEMSGKPATVWLGRIVDADELYINGKRVANTTYQYPQRRYKLEPGILKPGKNTFVIRITNNGGKGGFVPDKPYCIFSGKDTIDLKGTWHYKVGSVFEPRQGPGGPAFSAQNQPSALYNAMVAPLVGYGIKGFLWYQGESNAGRPSIYESLQKAQIKDWRTKWRDDSLPFLFVQLPGFMEMNYLPEESNWAVMRHAQLKSLDVPNTAMAVAIDLGEWNDIHPDNKKDVGERLALAAFNKAYQENIVYSGPVFQSAEIAGDKIVIRFSHTGSGLTTKDGEQPDNFAIAGLDKKFVWAQAKIEGEKIVVWSPKVGTPMYVRYAWADNPSNPNLINKEGLPACPFSTAD
ncbi:MAG: sialate O-acetylesterase [Chitinophagaceae bacterium]|nr:sialate O-acetylesterase [Chitinophagaceae bacterium]